VGGAFKAAAMGLGGGSGWVVLSLSFHDGDVRIASSSNHTQAIAHGSRSWCSTCTSTPTRSTTGADHAAYIDAHFKNVAWSGGRGSLRRALRAKPRSDERGGAPAAAGARAPRRYFLRLGALGFGGRSRWPATCSAIWSSGARGFAPDDFKQGSRSRSSRPDRWRAARDLSRLGERAHRRRDRRSRSRSSRRRSLMVLAVGLYGPFRRARLDARACSTASARR